MTVNEFLSTVRSNYPALPDDDLLSYVVCTPGIDPLDQADSNQDFRRQVAQALCLDFSIADRKLVRFLLRQEIQAHRHGSGYSDDLKLCAYPLFALGRLDDVELLWQAKSVSFDTFCGFDVQLLVGAGVEPTITYLHQNPSNETLAAVEYIKACQKAGDFDWLDEYRVECRQWLLS